MIHRIKLPYEDVSAFNNIANSFPNYVVQISQGNVTISAKSSFIGYSILDYNKEMILIVYDDPGNIIDSFSKWFI